MNEEVVELVEDFFAEAYDLLRMFEESVLLLEKEPDNHDAINRAFRAAHTIKGGSATVGFDKISQLTHLLESLLDKIREGEISITSDIADILLDSSDTLSQLLDAYYNKQEPNISTDINDRIKRYLDSDVSSEETKSNNNGASKQTINTDIKTLIDEALPINEYSKMQIAKEIDNGNKVYRLAIALDEDNPMKVLSPIQVLNLIKDKAVIINSRPTEEQIVDGGFVENMFFLVATNVDKDVMKDKLKISDVVKDIFIEEITRQDTHIGDGGVDNMSVTVAEDKEIKKEKPADIKKDNLQQKPETKKAKTQKEEPTTDKKKGHKATHSTILRVDSKKVDELLNLVGELIIGKSVFVKVEGDMREQTSYLEMVRNVFNKAVKDYIRKHIEDEEFDSENIIEIINNYFNREKLIYNAVKDALQNISRISSDLQESVMRIRMVPIEQLFNRLPRLVRDLGRELNKSVDIEITGQETELDKSVVELLVDPLIHILRNAIDHGIEPEDERIRLGKPQKGKIKVGAYHEGNMIIITISDDGRGMDAKKILQKAKEKGIKVSENMSYQDIINLVFKPGMSTADSITSISGRGVGMDIVKDSMEKLGGSVMVDSQFGKGTTIILKIPLTLAIIQALLVKINSYYYAIPMSVIIETLQVSKDEIEMIESKEIITVRGEIISILRLADIFKFEKEDNSPYINVVIVRYMYQKVGLVVDELVNEQDIVIKSIKGGFANVKGISGASILGDGKIALIIDVNQLVESYLMNNNI